MHTFLLSVDHAWLALVWPAVVCVSVVCCGELSCVVVTPLCVVVIPLCLSVAMVTGCPREHDGRCGGAADSPYRYGVLVIQAPDSHGNSPTVC